MTLPYVQNYGCLHSLLRFQMYQTLLLTLTVTGQQNLEVLQVLLQHLDQDLRSDGAGDLDVLDLMNVLEKHQIEAELLLNPSLLAANPTWA
jgi:hypothetical protein